MLLTIALDGPVGAGKSSVADGVAQKLGILHLDTGAMYRAFAWKALQKGVALEDEAALEALTATDLPEARYENGEQHTYICLLYTSKQRRTHAPALIFRQDQ